MTSTIGRGNSVSLSDVSNSSYFKPSDIADAGIIFRILGAMTKINGEGQCKIHLQCQTIVTDEPFDIALPFSVEIDKQPRQRKDILKHFTEGSRAPIEPIFIRVIPNSRPNLAPAYVLATPSDDMLNVAHDILQSLPEKVEEEGTRFIVQGRLGDTTDNTEIPV